MQERAQQILKNIFGYEAFRPLQAEIIANLLQKQDSQVIMPTGGGKSLCYQIPALIFEGLTVVVSPLISLMTDQVNQLRELGIRATFLNSTLSYDEYRQTLSRLRQNQIKLLYLAPETLLKTNVLTLLAELPVECLAIDEAHCISEWGHDFRPEYRQLIDARARFSAAACVALTATATPRVREDIRQSLQFQEANEFIASFDRTNLFLQVARKEQPQAQTVEFLKKFPEQSGIIYCFSRRQVDELAATLARDGFSVRPYHAGLSDDERKQHQELFIRDDIQIIVATVAFGMGINKPNVRFVVHYDLPKNLESYYQEIGRAGRDGLPAHCLLLLGYGDIAKIRYLIDQKDGQERLVANGHLNAMLRYAETHECRRQPLLRYFGEEYGSDRCDQCDNCTGAAKELVDLTIPAQKFLSCVHRTGQLFGANYIIDVLRASKSERILSNDHGNLSTYGIGKEYSKKQWLQLSRQFLQQELLVQDLQYGSLKLTTKAHEVLHGTATVEGVIEDEKVEVGGAAAKSQQYHDELFQLLRRKRKELADRANLPPYVIFSDKTLVEMATHLPQTEESLLGIHGVGAAKLKKYGATFLSLIYGYCRQQGISELAPPRVSYKIESPTPRKNRLSDSPGRRVRKHKHLVIGDAFNRGATIVDLMREHEIKMSTVLTHLQRYLQEGHPLRSEEFLELSALSAGQQQEVLQTFDRLGAEFLKPVYEALESRCAYDELRLLQLYYLSEHSA